MIDQQTVERRLGATFTRVADATPVPPLPALTDSIPPRNPSRTTARLRARRSGVAALTTVAVLGGGLSIAAAAGAPVLPGPVMRALGWGSTPGGYNADPAHARRLLTVPGPDGTELHLWYATTNDNGYCVSLSAADSTASGAASLDPGRVLRPGYAANGCDGPIGSDMWREFGADTFGSADATAEAYIVHVPGAVSARLRFANGTSRALPVAEHWTAVWLPRTEAEKYPVVVGYASDGTEVGRRALPPFHSAP